MLVFDVLYFLAVLLTLPVSAKFFLKKEYRTILKHRLSPDISPSEKKRIWIHAVSVGEVRSLKNLIKTLNEKYKEKEIVLSVTTPTGFHFAKQQYKNLQVINAPIDFSFTIKKFIKTINPELLILNELEIWPNWILITKRKRIPILLINGRISVSAFKRYRRFNFFLKLFFKKIDRFLLQADIYKERFLQLHIPAEKIKICGNIKADEAVKSLELIPPDKDILRILGINPGSRKSKKIFTLASSHLSDEKIVIPIIKEFRSKFLFIIVPRHLNRSAEIEKLLNRHQLDYTIWSRASAAGSCESGTPVEMKSGVLIYDRMGYLFHLLKISDVVFMGGTMEQRLGGHNLYEPAVLGKPVTGGPWYNNFPAIGDELSRKGIYHTVKNPEELSRFLERFHNPDGIDIDYIRSEAVRCVSRQMGSLHTTLEEIQQWVT